MIQQARETDISVVGHSLTQPVAVARDDNRYFRWALEYRRTDHLRAAAATVVVICLVLLTAINLRSEVLAIAAGMGGVVALLVGLNCLVGIYLVYGRPSDHYIQRLLSMAKLDGPQLIADFSVIGGQLAPVIARYAPTAQILEVDVWVLTGLAPDGELEHLRRRSRSQPVVHRRVHRFDADQTHVIVPTGSCDAVVLGLETYSIPAGEPRERLFREARRVLRPGGQLLLIGHSLDLQARMAFGSEVHAWPHRDVWTAVLHRHFSSSQLHHHPFGVDLYVATKRN